MRENRLKEIWGQGETAVNGWLQVPSSFSAEVMARAGWDSLTIDMQHGPVDYGSLVPMLQAISTTDTVPVVRVPWNDPGLIMRVLDAGCYAVICPMINTREEAEAFVGACRYPPEGYRSYGPYRATLYGGQDYTDHANETVVTMAMIETQQALDNLERILSVPGLDAVFVGPSDLGQSLGLGPGTDREEPAVVEAFDSVLAAARGHGLAAGIFTSSPEYASRMAGKGFQLVTISSDVRLMASAAASAITAFQTEYHGRVAGSCRECAGARGDFVAERETTVGPEEGIHGRPAARFVKAAKGFSSQVVVVKGDREVNAKSVLKITGLARKGERVTIRAEGEDAEQAVDTLAELIAADEH